MSPVPPGSCVTMVTKGKLTKTGNAFVRNMSISRDVSSINFFFGGGCQKLPCKHFMSVTLVSSNSSSSMVLSPVSLPCRITLYYSSCPTKRHIFKVEGGDSLHTSLECRHCL